MAMYQIKCTACDWETLPHYSSLDCVREKEQAHLRGTKSGGLLKEDYWKAHDEAFGSVCPKCGGKTEEVYKYFTDTEIERIRRHRHD